MRSENMLETRLSCCKIAKILFPLLAVAVVDHDGDGSI